MERYHILKLGLAILFYAAYCIRPMLVHGLRSNDLEQNKRTQQALKSDDYLVYYQGADGIPGVDFPVLSHIPRTSFSCKNIDSGYYADLDTDCQVFHICEEGKKISFLCPNGTIFEQSDLICEWWYKVNCTNSPNLYTESAEQLKEDLIKGKASRRVFLDGNERTHGAVMRTEESSSVSAKRNGQEFQAQDVIPINGKSGINVAANKQQIRGHNRNISNSPQRAIQEQQKPKRFNDADTGNHINNFNKPEANKNLKEYHQQFSDSSSTKSIFSRSTTPSSIPPSDLNGDRYKPVNRSRGGVRYGDVFNASTLKPSEGTLPDFPTHKSERTDTPRSKPSSSSSTSKQDSAVALTKNDIVNRKLEPESEEVQVPQETAAFASTPYNGIRKSSSKFSTNQYANHRSVYSALKEPKVSSPKFANSINSVTPQYITTQSINNGKPFVGSTVGGKVFKGGKGSFAAASTVSPISTTYLPAYEDSSRIIEISTYSPLSATSLLPPFVDTTKASVDHATVYGKFSKRPVTTPSPPNLVEVKFDKNQDKVGIQLGTSVAAGNTRSSKAKDVQISTQGSGSVFISGRGKPSVLNAATNPRGAVTTEHYYPSSTEAPRDNVLKYSSAVIPPLLTSDAFVHVGDGQSTLVSARGQSGATNTPYSGFAEGATSGTLSPVTVQGVPHYDSAVLPPLLTSGAFVHTNDIQSTTPKFISFTGSAATRGTEGFYRSTTLVPSENTPESQTVEGNLKYDSTVVPHLITSGGRIGSMDTASTPASIETQPFEDGSTKSQISVTIPPLTGSDTFAKVNFHGIIAGNSVVKGSDFSTTGSRYYESTTPLSTIQSLERETTSKYQAAAGNLKYGSTVVPPLITQDGLVHGDFQGTIRVQPEFGRTVSQTKDGSFYQGNTYLPTQVFTGRSTSAIPPLLTVNALVPSTGLQGTAETEIDTRTQTFRGSTTPNPTYHDENPKYGSSVVPPFLPHDAVVHTDDYRTATNSIINLPKTAAKQINADVSPNNIASTLAAENEPVTSTKTVEESPKYSSAVTPAFLTPNTVVHISDFQRTPSGTLVIDHGKNTSFITLNATTYQSTSRPEYITYISPVSNQPFNSLPGRPSKTVEKYSSPVLPPLLTPGRSGIAQSTENSVTSTPLSDEVSPTTFSGYYLPKNSDATSTPDRSPQNDLSLLNSESKWPRPFQKSPNSLSDEDLKTEPVTPTYFTYKISSARPFQLPEELTLTPTLPTPFTTAATQTSSVYENVDNMINILKEIASVDDDVPSETPGPEFGVPPSVDPQTLHTLAAYFANALDGISAERANVTGEELDDDSKEKLTSLLTQMTMNRYKALFSGNNAEHTTEVPTTEAADDLNDESSGIDPPALRNLARNFTLALSSYLNDPDAFKKELISLRPTEPPAREGEDNFDVGVGEEELLNFSDADTKSSFSPVFPTLPSVKPTWGYIIAGQTSDLDVKNSLNPDLNTADTQSFVPRFNNLAVDTGKSAKGFSKPDLPGDHWTSSPGATKLWQSAFSVNPVILNEEFKTTEPLPSTTEAYFSAPESSDAFNVVPQNEIRYDLRTLPKINVNSTQVHGILIDFMNTTKSDDSNRLQRLLKKLNTTEDDFLNRMKEIEANPLTRRLILLLISECAANATNDVATHSISSLPRELIEPSNSSVAVSSHSGRQIVNSPVPELVDPNLQQDDQDTRALQLLNSLYTIASRFGK